MPLSVGDKLGPYERILALIGKDGMGEVYKARTTCHDFFTNWKDAAAGIPFLKEAQAEYRKATVRSRL
jgi:hypothetical protein